MTDRLVHPTARDRSTRVPVMLTIGLLVGATGATVGCSLHERVCSEGRYPVVEATGLEGKTCVDDGDEPPSGYMRYPADKVPVYLEDDYKPTWRDYLDYGDKTQRQLAREQLR